MSYVLVAPWAEQEFDSDGGCRGAAGLSKRVFPTLWEAIEAAKRGDAEGDVEILGPNGDRVWPAHRGA